MVQKRELTQLYGKKFVGSGKMDYVTGWYIKAAEYIQNTSIHVAFVSTNSITQGEQPPILWTKLKQYNIKIIFAYRTFIWESEANMKAHVHCVILGFCIASEKKNARIYSGSRYIEAKNINPYLIDAPTVLIKNRKNPLDSAPEMEYGSMPIDDNNLILDKKDVEELLKENVKNKQFIREYVGGNELLNATKRWCLWLYEINPEEYMDSKFIMNRIEATRRFRLNSGRFQTKKMAETPQLFGEIRQPKNGALAIPKVSSEDRRYIPISYVDPGVIINGSTLMIPEATLYHFGILSSNVHNSWMRVVAGRMKSDYQYSIGMVYNTFPWPEVTEDQVLEITKAREKHQDINLAKMYKEKNFLLFGDLKTAHDNLNRIVMKAYNMPIKETTESDCVAKLMELYSKKAVD